MAYYSTLADAAQRDNHELLRQKMRSIRRSIPHGDAGIDETVDDMRMLTKRDKTHKVIKAIAQRLKGRSELETVKNTFRHVVKTISYESDPEDRELLVAPRHLLTWRPRGDCDDMSMALAALLEANGIKSAFRVIAWRKRDYTHVYVMTYLDSLRRWIPLDAVMGNAGFGNEQTPILRRKTYEV